MKTLEFNDCSVSCDYTGADLVCTVAVSVFSWAILFAVSSHMYLGGTIIGFLLLFLLGYWFPTTPARIIGYALMASAAILGFYKGVQSEFGFVAGVPLLLTLTSAFLLLWGFWEGTKRLSEAENGALKSELNDTISAIALSLVCFSFECALGRIPYAGFFLGVFGALLIGYVLGWIDFPLIEKILIATAALAGLALGLFWQFRGVTGWPMAVGIGSFLGKTALCFGVYRANKLSEEKKTIHEDENASSSESSDESC